MNTKSIEALSHVAHGLTIDDVTDMMRLSRSSVEKYLKRARNELGCRTIAHAVHVATKRGLVMALLVAVSLGNYDTARRVQRSARREVQSVKLI